MTKSILIDVLKFVVLIGLCWGVFYYVSSRIDKSTSDIGTISIDNEEKLGRMLVDEVLLKDPKIKISSNQTLDSAMQQINKRLLSNIGLTEYEYNIRVIDSPEINAFTMPGGNIFVYTGLIKFSETPEEVAAVLAHEIGHAEKRHVVTRLIKELGITILFSVVTGGDAVLLPEIARTATSTVFDRKQEKEADDYGLQLLEKSSINPKALATFFRRVDEKTGKTDNYTEIIATHPNNNSRIKAALEYELPGSFKPKGFDINWQTVKASLGEE